MAYRVKASDTKIWYVGARITQNTYGQFTYKKENARKFKTKEEAQQFINQLRASEMEAVGTQDDKYIIEKY